MRQGKLITSPARDSPRRQCWAVIWLVWIRDYGGARIHLYWFLVERMQSWCGAGLAVLPYFCKRLAHMKAEMGVTLELGLQKSGSDRPEASSAFCWKGNASPREGVPPPTCLALSCQHEGNIMRADQVRWKLFIPSGGNNGLQCLPWLPPIFLKRKSKGLMPGGGRVAVQMFICWI